MPAKLHFGLYSRTPVDLAKGASDQGWPAEAETMIGLARPDMLQQPVQNILLQNVPGDLIETVVWRGGGSIFMRAVLKALGDALDNLYAKLSPGGYAVIDDYGAGSACRRAVDDFRDRYQIRDTIETIDWSGVFLRKASCPPSHT